LSRYKLVRPFIRRVLNDLTVAAMQTERDAARIGQLGMPENRICIAGNLKFDSVSATSDSAVDSELRDRFGFHDGRSLIVAASTHDPEERVVIDAFRKVRQTHADARLLIAPRHPERFENVAALLSNSDFSSARRSAPRAAEDAHSDIVLLDSMGELRAVYPLADVAFVGGSIAPHGGHSVIEPGAHGVCTVTGPHTENFAAVTQALLDEDALIQLRETDEPAGELARVFTELLSDKPGRRAIAERAKAVCDRNRGATARTIELISHLLDVTRAESGKTLPFSALHAATAK
jgi:3-deoxy-D-manno-octulosonic-acid transferase